MRPQSPWSQLHETQGSSIGGLLIKEELTSGTYYRTHAALREADLQVVAARIVKGFDGLPASVKDAAFQEAERWNALSHVNLAPLGNYFLHQDALIFVGPPPPSLGAAPFAPAVLPLPRDAVALVGFQLAGALVSVHGAGLVHRNVRPASLALLAADGGAGAPGTPEEAAALLVGGCVKLGDHSGVLATALCPSEGIALAYAAPEMLNDEPATAKNDVWGFGATLLELATGHVVGDTQIARKLLKRGNSKQWTLEQSLRGAYATDSSRVLVGNAAQVAAWDALPVPMRALITDCLNLNAADRPTSEQVLAHEAFAAPRSAQVALQVQRARATIVHNATLALRAKQPMSAEAVLALVEASNAGPGVLDDTDVHAVCNL